MDQMPDIQRLGKESFFVCRVMLVVFVRFPLSAAKTSNSTGYSSRGKDGQAFRLGRHEQKVHATIPMGCALGILLQKVAENTWAMSLHGGNDLNREAIPKSLVCYFDLCDDARARWFHLRGRIS